MTDYAHRIALRLIRGAPRQLTHEQITELVAKGVREGRALGIAVKG
jgi:hypothetical protein